MCATSTAALQPPATAPPPSAHQYPWFACHRHPIKAKSSGGHGVDTGTPDARHTKADARGGRLVPILTCDNLWGSGGGEGRNRSGVDPPLSLQPRLPHGLHCSLSSSVHQHMQAQPWYPRKPKNGTPHTRHDPDSVSCVQCPKAVKPRTTGPQPLPQPGRQGHGTVWNTSKASDRTNM